ncbi:hypothetical protein LINGRAHAP2_LOCUS18346 [Linum grandiflorum]
MIKAEGGGGDDKPDGLEIVSVGALYSGPLDKKYWSSSRGKDRYPYPVGYQARRTYNGTMYKMQINEGPKGPLFVITAADGESCSAQTPDITWDKFQKKGCQQMKRFSCKIDGIEFFGFKNPLVQRLLRELVSNVNGIAKLNLLPSSLCNEISEGEHHDPQERTDVGLELVSPLLTGKRSKRRKPKTPTPLSSFGSKRPRKWDPPCTTEVVLNPVNENCKHQISLDTSTFDSIDEPEKSKRIPATKSVVSEGENCLSPAEDGLPLKSLDASSNDRKVDFVYAIEEATLSASKDDICVAADGLHIKGTVADRSPDGIVESLDIPTSANEKDRHECYQNKTLDVPMNFLCAPDTLDPMEEYAPNAQGHSMCFDKEESSIDTTISERVVSESNQGNEITTWMTRACIDKEEPVVADTFMSEEVLSEPNMEADTTISERLVSESNQENDITTRMTRAGIDKEEPIAADTFMSEEVLSEPNMEADTTISERLVSESNQENYITTRMTRAGIDQEEPIAADTFMSEELLSERNMEADTTISERLVSESNQGNDITTQIIRAGIDKEEPIVADTFMSEEVLSEADMEDELAIGSSSGSSEKFDSDSAGQDTANLMMTLLLPQAIPLLKGTSNKKRKSSVMVKNFISRTKPQEENEEILGGQFSKIEQTKAVVVDSFEDEQCEAYALGQPVLLSDSTKGEQSGDRKDERIPHTSDDPLNREVRKADMEISVASSKSIAMVTRTSETKNEAVCPGHRKVYTRRKAASKAVKHSDPLSESRICRNYGKGGDPRSTLNSEPLSVSPSIDDARQKDLSKDKIGTGGHPHFVEVENITTSCRPESDDLPICVPTEGERISNVPIPYVPVSEETQFNCIDRLAEHGALVDVDGSLTSQSKEVGMESSGGIEVQANADLKLHSNFELNFNLEGIAEIVGCYMHPLPVVQLWLSSQENEIYICALCGILPDKHRTLFLYKLATNTSTTGFPSFVGHTTVSWPSPVHMFGKVAPERSSFQLTPDGQLLVLHGSTKVPCCREGRMDCLCSTCEADSCSSSSVKIVRVYFGHVSVLLELRTDEEIECILVCEPNHLVAAVESGKLHLWTMDSTWSTSKEEHTISNMGYYSPRIVELKSIPKSASLVLGHDGFEEFTLWDISRRTFISRFSAPGASVHAFNPISWFSWQTKAHCFSSYNPEDDYVSRTMEATKSSLTDNPSPHKEGEGIAIWLLISTNNATDDPVGSWRLALLAKNTMILGATLDPGAVAVGTIAGRGVIATDDGAVSMWDLLTGNKLGSLHHFKDGRVSCIARDDSSSSSCFAVGSQTGQLLVYRNL